ncbi:hypothetical protein IscW_ISCW000650 [Ixodes scapularis]|uniref:Kinesin motor domain-containing protein n=1 Tax=Ixodes scapularis TaxID=6945 RepID=B7P3X6_IXOSC|nr:hypothetical protein IscW_ISCW000650 [Ixodes scapularis]|eukprot:XP_002404774.1 hypothetical protein IscW_ISCW000650 [Ixodes scapularis]
MEPRATVGQETEGNFKERHSFLILQIANPTELRVPSAVEALHQLEVRSASRSTGSTEMNARSSRSHAIYTLAVELKERGGNDDVQVASRCPRRLGAG